MIRKAETLRKCRPGYGHSKYGRSRFPEFYWGALAATRTNVGFISVLILLKSGTERN
jgi:hypothetical protein